MADVREGGPLPAVSLIISVFFYRTPKSAEAVAAHKKSQVMCLNHSIVLLNVPHLDQHNLYNFVPTTAS